MSAIFGICNAESKPVDSAVMNSIMVAMNHWQADAAESWVENNIGLGHLMLFNTPESVNERLPLVDRVSGLAITSDARIDNREDLYPLLGISTSDDKLVGDSTIILLLYRKFGRDCVNYLIGDFAFAIWDGGMQELFCARDQMGVKPLFYYKKSGFFVFASEKKGILSDSRSDKAINKQYFYNQTFIHNLQAADETLYQFIKRVEPAHYLVYRPDNDEIITRRYWILDADSELLYKNKRDYAEGLRTHFENAVKCRLRTLYPVGLELSGGMDSSSIAGVVSHFLKGSGKRISTFTNADSEISLPFSNLKGGGELNFAKEVIEFNKIEDPVLIDGPISKDPMEIVEMLAKIVDGLEMWDLAWQLPIKQAAKERNIRTMFSGFPGDEMVTYRGQYCFLDLLDHHKYMKYFTYKINYRFNKIKPLMGPRLQFLVHKLRNILTINDREATDSKLFLRVPLKYRLSKGDSAWKDLSYRERFNSYRHFQRYRLLKPQVSLRLETENSYGNWFRHESTFPMADIRLTQYYLSLPNEIKYTGELTRTLWRESMVGYLPESILKRDLKLALMVPYNSDPSRSEFEMQALASLVDKSKMYSAAEKMRILNGINGNRWAMKYVKLLHWLEKNFEIL